MKELCYLTITEASGLIRQRKLSPVELVQAHLDRITALDPELRSYITVSGEIALRQAKKAAAEIAQGRYAGPLHGIPVNYKDLIATAGIRTTAASRIYEDWIPARDACCVARLRRAGAVTLGKASLNEFAFSPASENDFIKQPRNPWNVQYSPGVSSSGSGASVAAGLAMASLATDSGGSIRIPASYCGVTGLKPTYGLVGRTGLLPLSYSLDHIGAMTRTAADAALVLEVLAGHDPEDRASSARPAPRYSATLSTPIKGLRLGTCEQFMEQAGVDDEVRAAFDKALDAFRSLGTRVQDIGIAHLNYGAAANFTLLRVEGFQAHLKNLKERPKKYGPGAFRQIAIGGFLSVQDYFRAQQARTLISAELARVFEKIEILLTPATGGTASGASYRKPATDSKVARSNVSFLAPFNLTGSPALSICCGFNSAGMPIGLQLVGRAFDETTILRAAHQYQAATDWHRRRPPV